MIVFVWRYFFPILIFSEVAIAFDSAHLIAGGFPSCNTPGCTRNTWNGQHGEQCCRTCMATNGASHGLDCQAKEACEMLQACTHDEPGAPPRSLPPARSPAPHPANPPPAFPTGGPAFPTGGNPGNTHSAPQAHPAGASAQIKEIKGLCTGGPIDFAAAAGVKR